LPPSARAVKAQLGPSGLPLTADGISELLAGRARSFPSPFAPEDVSDFAPDEWTSGPGAKAEAERVASAREAALAGAVVLAMRKQAARTHRGTRAQRLSERAKGSPRESDPALVRLMREHVAKSPVRATGAADPGLATAKYTLVGVPDRWTLGIDGPGRSSRRVVSPTGSRKRMSKFRNAVRRHMQ